MADRYGVFTIESEPQSGLTNAAKYYVENHEGDRVKTGDGDSGQQRARTLAATLHTVEAGGFDLLPPGMLLADRPRGHPSEASENEWQSWAAETNVVPARVAAAGKAPLAGYLNIVHRERDSWIGGRLGVSEATVRQYLSDLRAGRR
jgi:hypothetical protein